MQAAAAGQAQRARAIPAPVAAAFAAAPASSRLLLLRSQRPLHQRPLFRRAPRAPSSINNDASSSGPLEPEIEALMRKYDPSGASTPAPGPPSRAQPQPQPALPSLPLRRAASPGAKRAAAATSSSAAAAAASAPVAGNGTFLLCFLCLAAFLADNVLHLPLARSALRLVSAHGAVVSPPFTVLTHAFAHADWGHLSANLFPLLVFGKLVEETEGPLGVILCFCLTAAGAALASAWLTPSGAGAVVSVGASGAVFGMFAVAVLTRLSRDPRRLLEFFVLGQFVVGQVLNEARAQVAGGTVLPGTGIAVSHVAHLTGALAGVLLVMLLRAIPEPPPADGARR